MNFYDFSDSTFTRAYREEVEITFSGIDCVLNGEKAIYCSSELTTGMRLYEALREHRLKTAAELKEKMGAEWFHVHIFGFNVHAAAGFARSARARVDDDTMVITPAHFNAPQWTQPEYLGFWETLIRTRTKKVWFNRNWEFSNGCAFEYAVAADAGVATCNHLGAPLEPKQAIRALHTAIAQLNAEGFDTAKLRENLGRL
jgi:hypothetical protein